MIIRQPIVAGHFYPGTAEKLNTLIKTWGTEPEPILEPALGVITPHGAYDQCGPVIFETFKRVSPVNTFVLLGPHHNDSEKQAVVFQRGIWTTPFGEVSVDNHFTQLLSAEMPSIKEDIYAHDKEHCLEVQLPIMQYLIKTPFKIVPILLPTEFYNDLALELSSAITRTIQGLSQSTAIIATTDMSRDLSPEMAKRKDQMLINDILHMEIEEILSNIKRYGIRYCGLTSLLTLLYVTRDLGATGGELIDYICCGENEDDFARVNGYAGILVK